jgi:hypothetical protein
MPTILLTISCSQSASLSTYCQPPRFCPVNHHNTHGQPQSAPPLRGASPQQKHVVAREVVDVVGAARAQEGGGGGGVLWTKPPLDQTPLHRRQVERKGGGEALRGLMGLDGRRQGCAQAARVSAGSPLQQHQLRQDGHGLQEDRERPQDLSLVCVLGVKGERQA